jgi:hypothetical protein
MTKTVAKNKNDQVGAFLAGLKSQRRLADSHALIEMMQSVAGEPPEMWGPSIIGFGMNSYELAGRKSEKIFRIGFSPRAGSLVLYLGRFPSKEKLLLELGKHRCGASCIYINKLLDVNEDILREMLHDAYHSKGST